MQFTQLIRAFRHNTKTTSTVIFTVRCICIAWYMLSCSVHLSVTCMHRVYTTELIIKQLVLTPDMEHIPLGIPSSGALNSSRGEIDNGTA